jgi:hypothetical protein
MAASRVSTPPLGLMRFPPRLGPAHPVALIPATSDSEKISFNQTNRKTGHRIRYLKVDADAVAR